MDSTTPLMPPGLEGVADTQEKADKQLQVLLSKRGNVNNPELDFWVKQTKSSLETFETQLNSSSGHFIFELLQNADDNNYDPSVTPTFRMKLVSSSGGHVFHTSCNESGFSIEQIESLCEIGDSTKKHHKDIEDGYIGEKGLGFKSVFSVADVVHVSSGFYSFKLDKTQPMGEFMPMPSPFPVPDHSDEKIPTTRMMLQIKKDHAVVQNTLQDITPEILLFLRRLRCIQIDAGAYQSLFFATRNVHDNDFFGETRTVKTWIGLEKVETTTKYIISRSTVENMPEEDKRAGVTVSEVALGFPLTCNNKADSRPQHAFSFIPFKKAGFHFLIQGDFILVASRESHVDNRWNQKLRHAIPKTFEKAVKRFIKAQSELRYTWPGYLGHGTLGDDFWRELETSIIKHLNNLPILQSRAPGGDCFQKPSNLTFIPTEYRLDGKALIDSPDQQRRQLAFEYTPHNILSQGLERLGVREMSFDEFTRTFREWIGKQEPAFLDSMTEKWHAEVAKLCLRHAGYRFLILDIPLVPTTSGKWVTANERMLFRVSEEAVHGIPSSLGLQIVAPAARLSHIREQLFQFLKIEELTPTDICYRILRLHKREIVRSRSQLVEETTYLFAHRDSINPSYTRFNIWFATTDELVFKRGHSAYGIFPMSLNFIEHCYTTRDEFMQVIHLIHPEHVEHACRFMESQMIKKYASDAKIHSEAALREEVRKSLFKWLEGFCGVAGRPRLVCEGQLSQEGSFLLRKQALTLLQLLRLHWKVYQKDKQVLKEVLCPLMTPCQDGQRRSLENTAVPSLILKKACPHLSFASLPYPDDDRWAFLSNFSVTTEPNVAAYVRELSNLRDKTPTSTTVEDARRIYQYLAAKNADQVRRCVEATFPAGDKSFVFHPTREWVSTDECIWKSPCAFQTTLEISKIYPALENFFCGVIGIKNAGVREVIEELERLNQLPSHSEKSSLLKRTIMILNEYLASETPESSDNLRQRLRSLQIFPVVTAAEQPADMARATIRSLADVWYIADQPTLKKEFLGHVDILDFDITEIEELGPLTEWLQLEKLLLSKAVEERKVVTGVSVYRQDWSKALERRTGFISLLGECRESDSVKPPPALRVFQVSGVQIWKKAGGKEILTGNGDISIEKKDGSVDIFLRHDPSEYHIQADHELAGFFVQLYSVAKKEYATLVPLIMKASDDDARALLEKYSIRCPCAVDSEDCDGDATTVASEPLLTTAALNDVLTRIITTPAPLRCPDSSGSVESRERSAGQEKLDRHEEVGLLGEALINYFFKKRIPDWDADRHWTSKLRARRGHSPFTENESKFSDFTYTDEHDHMFKVLQRLGYGCSEWTGQRITYHVEVKATVFGCDEAFSLSQNQMSMALKYTSDDARAPKDLFIVARAYDVARKDWGLKFYIDLWSNITRGMLIMKSDSPYSIKPARS